MSTAWDIEPWEPVQLDTVDSEPEIIDAYWQPVDDAPVIFADDEPVEVHVEWLEVDQDSYPVPRDNSGTNLEHYEPTQEDMATANEWLARVETMTQPQTQLATRTEVQPQTRTAFWQRVTSPVRTAVKHEGYSWASNSTRASSGNRKPGWYFIAEKDPNEPEMIQNLRYWYMESEFNDGITEWDEAAFMAWVASLSDNELATFADAGEQIAQGNWQEHVSDEASEVIDQTRDSKEREGSDHVGYFFESLRKVF